MLYFAGAKFEPGLKPGDGIDGVKKRLFPHR
jgi:hypothetical protein